MPLGSITEVASGIPFSAIPPHYQQQAQSLATMPSISLAPSHDFSGPTNTPTITNGGPKTSLT
jgi:hypothetical protein